MRRDQKGFTLIELLVAITLVSAIATGMLFAMRTSLTTLDKVDSRLISNRRVISVNQILSREISGAMPVTGICGNTPHVPVFNGTGQTLLLVSSYSLTEASRGDPRILQLQVLPSPNGGMMLIVNESLYTGPASTQPFCLEHSVLPAQPTPDSFVLADRLEYALFAYEEYNPQNPAQQQWLPMWNKPDLPSAVRVDMLPLNASGASLPLLPITVPIHVTRQVMFPYADQ